MTRKGTSYLVNVSLPAQPVQRNVPPPEKVNFKDKKAPPCDPPEGLPQAAPAGPQLNVEVGLEQYYKAGFSVLEDSISFVKEKTTLVIRDPEISPADTKRMARKLGREKKYLKFVQADLMNIKGLDEETEVMVAAQAEEGPEVVEAEVPVAVHAAEGLAVLEEAEGPVAP